MVEHLAVSLSADGFYGHMQLVALRTSVYRQIATLFDPGLLDVIEWRILIIGRGDLSQCPTASWFVLW